MKRILVVEAGSRLGDILAERLRTSSAVAACRLAAQADGDDFDTLVYVPRPAGRKQGVPDLADAERVFRHCASAGVRRAVVLSSAAVYGPNCHNPGLLAEARPACRHRKNTIAHRWWELEVLAEQWLGDRAGGRLTILRPAAVPLRGAAGPLAGLFHGRLAFPLAGYDPSIQLLSPHDLAAAVCRAVEADRGGVYHVAPTQVIPLRQALRLAGVARLPLPYLFQRALRAVLSRLGLGHPGDRLEYLRYSWTVSGGKIADEIGFVPERSSAEALCDGRVVESGRPPRRAAAFAGRRFDDFGFDPRYFDRFDRTLAPFLEHCYWRMETRGLGHVPRTGPAVLVGIHRGFMPFDGFVVTHRVARAAGRVPRFLIHPGLVKFPFLFNFMTKQGGLIACNENADYVLRRGGLLALYPEGVHGAFRLYREAYTLGGFNRDEYVRMALRNRASIVPFVTLGSAEIFPILARLDWPWWKRYSEWPCFPITPTFPLLPVPLPSKWHTLFLEPVHVGRDYPPEAADDELVVRSVGRVVRRRMEEALTWMRGRRRSIFFGSVFDGEAPPTAVDAPAEALTSAAGR
jgi:1-acyl-sn-glycerol-3-phosphate acyltransferase